MHWCTLIPVVDFNLILNKSAAMAAMEKLVAFYSNAGNRTASESRACKANYGAGQVPFLFCFGISSIRS
jgi:hypothetical protein